MLEALLKEAEARPLWQREVLVDAVGAVAYRAWRKHVVDSLREGRRPGELELAAGILQATLILSDNPALRQHALRALVRAPGQQMQYAAKEIQDSYRRGTLQLDRESKELLRQWLSRCREWSLLLARGVDYWEPLREPPAGPLPQVDVEMELP